MIWLAMTGRERAFLVEVPGGLNLEEAETFVRNYLRKRTGIRTWACLDGVGNVELTDGWFKSLEFRD